MRSGICRLAIRRQPTSKAVGRGGLPICGPTTAVSAISRCQMASLTGRAATGPVVRGLTQVAVSGVSEIIIPSRAKRLIAGITRPRPFSICAAHLPPSRVFLRVSDAAANPIFIVRSRVVLLTNGLPSSPKAITGPTMRPSTQTAKAKT